jgi:hypothetical protein
MTDDSHRYYVRSPDGRMITGYDRPDAAKAVALEYGEARWWSIRWRRPITRSPRR